MSTIFRSRSCIVALLALGLASTASTQTILVPQDANGTASYVSGGIGEDEAEAMRQASANYPLTLELATAAGGPRDAYISDAKVDIRDGNGNPVISTTTQGPIMLVRLPAGTYTVDVGWHGTEKHKTVEVSGERRQHVMLEFPDDPSNH
jgi:hypothetical protein